MHNEHQLFSGVQLIHKNNHTHTTREGYALPEDIDNMIELPWNGEGSEYHNLNPGLYKINIDGTQYSIMMHDTLSGENRLIIKSVNNAYTLIGLKPHKVYLYKLNQAPIIDRLGYRVPYSVNDAFDLFVVDGVTRCKAGNSVSMRWPGELEFISMMNIRVSTSEDEYDDYLFNMKNYLKSIDLDKDHKVHDTMYLERAVNRATFIFRTARLVLTGREPFETVTEYSNGYVNVFRYANPLIKPSGLVKCSHLPTIDWEDMINTNYINEGICLSPDGVDPAIYFKLPVSGFKDLEAFQAEVLRWYRVSPEEERLLRWTEAREHMAALGYDPNTVLLHSITACPVTICYELNRPQYKQLTLDSYNINTKYNECWIEVKPYRAPGKHTRQWLKNLIGLVPKNGVIKSMAEQLEESGSAEKYAQILEENEIWDNLFTQGLNAPYGNLIGPEGTLTGEPVDYSDESTVVVVPKNGAIPSIAYQQTLSGRSDKYAQILDENYIWRNLVYGETIKNYDGYLMDANTVAVLPNDGIIKTMAEQMKESGYSSQYEKILRENTIWRNLVLGGYIRDRNDLINLDEGDIVAVLPKDGIIKTMAEQLQESGFRNMYAKILAENIIWRNIVLTGELHIRMQYYYKRLERDGGNEEAV